MEFTEDQLKQLIALGMIDEQKADVLRSMKRAEANQDAQMPGGMAAGGTFVAANPLSGIATMLRQYKGNKDAKALKAEQEALRQQQMEGRNTYAEGLGSMGGALRGGGTPQLTPQELYELEAEKRRRGMMGA